MFSILRKEILDFFSNITGYIVVGVFLIINGLFLWIIPGEYNIIESGYATLDSYFYLVPWLYLFLCPAITMNSIAGERVNGTWELLITKPVSKFSLISAKFFGSWLVVLLALLPTIIYFISVYFIAQPAGNVDGGAFTGSFIGLILLAGVFLAIGIFSSSLIPNQIVVYIIALVLSFFMFWGFELFSTFFKSGALLTFIDSLGINYHFKSISKGVIDFSDLSYFLFLIIVFLFLTDLRLRRK